MRQDRLRRIETIFGGCEMPDLETARRATAGDSVVVWLGDAIRAGQRVPGERLVEAELSRDLGVSRGTLREALRHLAAEGIVEIAPNRGAMVRRLTRTEALELFEIRAELEAFAVRRAAARMGEPGVRAQFVRATAEIRDDGPRHSTSDYLEENRRFHGAVFAAAGNRQLVELNWRQQLSLIMAQIAPALTSEILAASIDDHRVVARAVTEGRPADAERAMRGHLARAVQMIREMPEGLFRRDGAGSDRPAPAERARRAGAGSRG